ncbi:MAG: efflux RND transporter permease subunit [Solimonas sp.]
MSYAAVVAWSLRNRLLVLAAALVLVVCGVQVARSLPVDVLPDLTRPTVSVQVEALGLAPADVEAQLSFPIETALSGLPDVQRVRSVSSVGLSVVYAEFAWGSDVYRNRQLVAERLDALRAQLPDGAQPRIGPLTSLMGEVLLVALQADGDAVDPMRLRDLADWQLRPALLAVPGVAQVLAIGGESRQYEIRPDVQRMRLLDVTLDQVEAATRGFGRDGGAGFAERNGQELSLRSRATPFDLDDLREVAVAWRGDAPIRLRQVAEVAVGARLKRGDAGADGHAAVILAIQKQPDVDTLRLTAALEQRLAQLDAGLPAGVSRLVLFRQADFIGNAVQNVREALLLGALIVALVLAAFIASGRATLVTLTAIPLSVLGAIVVLRALGLSINTMTLGGLAIAVGELVDDAVIGVENIARRLRGRRDGESPLAVIAGATVEVRSGVLYATLVIVLVFVPLFALEGIEGRLFAPLGIAYIAAIAGSLVVAVTVSPVLASYAFGADGRLPPPERRWLRALKARYLALLRPALRRPLGLLAGAVVLLVAALAIGAQLPRAFLPSFNEGTLTVNLVLRPGIALTESDRLGRTAESLILSVPGVAHVGRRTGRAELDEHAEGIHYAEFDVALRDDAPPRAAIVTEIRHRLSALPGSVAIGQPISHRLDHLLSGVRAPFVVKLFGDDAQVLQALAARVRDTLAGLPGFADVQVERQEPLPQLDIRIDPRRAGQYGLSPPQVQRTLAALSIGLPLTQIVEGERRYELVLRLREDQRAPDALEHLLIDAPAGPVPLGWLADFEPATGAGQILREDLRRRLAVSAYPAAAGFERDSARAQQALAALALPPGYELRIEGESIARQQAVAHIAGLSLLSLLLMAAVPYGRYRSWALTAIVLGNVPLALIGGVLALAFSGNALSVASLVGFVPLAGIAARNGILKLSHYLNLAVEGAAAGAAGEEDGAAREARVLRGSAERLVPVLMTASIAALALLPLLLGGDAPGQEILHPVAVVIFGGLLVGTLLDSFLTPALYLRFGTGATVRLLKNQQSSAF